MTRRAARRDDNHAEVVAAFRSVGALVQDLADVGDGCPDLLIGIPCARKLVFCEIKDGDKEPARRKLTPEQVKWHAKWDGYPVHIIESVDEALAIVAAIKAGEL